MPLDRDIVVGRQRAVTGHGIFESTRIWDEALLENLREQEWFNSEDFGKGLAVAKVRYPQPQQTVPLHARASHVRRAAKSCGQASLTTRREVRFVHRRLA